MLCGPTAGIVQAERPSTRRVMRCRGWKCGRGAPRARARTTHGSARLRRSAGHGPTRLGRPAPLAAALGSPGRATQLAARGSCSQTVWQLVS
eukprot:6673738-Prymnesium_polylepis.1